MKKFFILTKKEIKELLTVQVVVPLLAMVLIFAMIGKIASKQASTSTKSAKVTVLDLDNSSSSSVFEKLLSQGSVTIETEKNQTKDEVIASAKKDEKAAVIVIPNGFEKGLKTVSPVKIELYTIYKNFSFSGTKNLGYVQSAIASANEAISNNLLLQKDSTIPPQNLKRPIPVNNFVVVGDRQANVDPQQIIGFISSQTTFIPIILFIVIVFASQMIATAIATEKENKTLETLLTLPVNRKYIVTAKMVAAGIVALLAALVYMVGFKYFVDGMSGGVGVSASSFDAGVKEAARSLDLVMSPMGYTILGLSLFIGILCALSIAIILGSFAEDSKSVQGIIMPLTILVLIPYFLVLFMDISSLSTTARYLIYAIPFTHNFLAAPNIFLHNYSAVFYGLLYEFAFFIIFVLIAAKIFSTDRIITMKFSFKGKKNKLFPYGHR